MTYIAHFFIMMLTALFIENIIFTRALGTSWLLYLIKKPGELLRCTVLLTVITTLSGMIGYPLRGLAEESEHSYILIPMIYILCIAVVYIGVYFFIKYVMPETYEKAEFNLGAAAFNCAVLGSLLVPSVGRMDFISTIGYGLGLCFGGAYCRIWHRAHKPLPCSGSVQGASYNSYISRAFVPCFLWACWAPASHLIFR